MITLTYMGVTPDVAEHTVTCQQHAQSTDVAFLYIDVPSVIPQPA